MSARRLTAAVATLVVALAPTAGADDSRSTTRDGKTLTASKAVGLQAAGERVRVRGTGYDRNKGIYVAFCVDNGPGKVPTPCGGGADTEGSSGNSVWISDFPPAYGAGLAQPYGEGGSFDVEIAVRAQLREDDPETEQDEAVDCRTTRCAVVTRNDHTRSDDRSQDVTVPVSFASTAAPTTAAGSGGGGGTAAAPEQAAAPAAPGAPAAAPSRGTSPVASANPTGSATPSASASSSASSSASAPAAPAAGTGETSISGGSLAAGSAADDGGAPVALLAVAAAALAAVVAVLLRRRLRGRVTDVA